jgi:thiosulfate/3-mercaptopyruvate sulfurtransferase
MQMGYIMEKEELLPLLDSSDIRICDCRLSRFLMQGLMNTKDHISGAVYFDLKRTYRGG